MSQKAYQTLQTLFGPSHDHKLSKTADQMNLSTEKKKKIDLLEEM